MIAFTLTTITTPSGRILAGVTADGDSHYLGTFATMAEAEAAYDAWADSLEGSRGSTPWDGVPKRCHEWNAFLGYLLHLASRGRSTDDMIADALRPGTQYFSQYGGESVVVAESDIEEGLENPEDFYGSDDVVALSSYEIDAIR